MATRGESGIAQDIEDDDFEDQEDPAEPLAFWKKKQREIVTSVVDYNLSTLADLVEEGSIDANPRYQRRNRWDTVRSSRLIESFLMNVPVPPVFLNEDEFGQYSIIDGKQRLTAITDFIKGRLRLEGMKVFSDVNDMTIADLPAGLRTIVKTRPTLRAVIILPQSDQDIKFEVFQRLNTGGVKLNAQEIRNSAFPGALNDTILDLSTDKEFHRILGIRKKETSVIYSEMRDAEFVLRFFAFQSNWKTFTGGMKRHMDSFMAENRNASARQIAGWKRTFRDRLDSVQAAFGETCFRRWMPEKEGWRKPVLAAIYDAQMFGCEGYGAEQLAPFKKKLDAGMRRLFEEDNFRSAIDSATNTPSYFKARIEAVRALVQKTVD